MRDLSTEENGPALNDQNCRVLMAALTGGKQGQRLEDTKEIMSPAKYQLLEMRKGGQGC